MTWQCKLVVYDKSMTIQNGGLKVGDMFYAPDPESENYTRWLEFNTSNLSDYYKQNNSGRRPLIVVFPGPYMFCIDEMCWRSGERYGGWTVTGKAPLITVSPSINIGGTYHGFLQNGLLGDDVEGRMYNVAGEHYAGGDYDD